MRVIHGVAPASWIEDVSDTCQFLTLTHLVTFSHLNLLKLLTVSKC